MARDEDREQLVSFGKKLLTGFGTVNLLLGIFLTLSNFIIGLRVNFRLSLILFLIINLIFIAAYLYYIGWSEVVSPIQLPGDKVRKNPRFPRYHRPARVSFALLGMLAGITLLIPQTRTFVIDSLILPPTVPAPPASEKLYYMTVVDASDRMLGTIDGSDQKWQVAVRSLQNKLSILPSGANFGLVAFGQAGMANSTACDEAAEVLVPVNKPGTSREAQTASSQQRALSAAAGITPGNKGSLTKAISLAVDQMVSGLPDTYSKTIIIVTGGGDACNPGEEWDSLQFLLSGTIKDLSVYTELIVFVNEEVKEEIDAKVQEISRLEGVTVSLPTTAEELNEDLEEAVDRAIVRGMVVDPQPFIIQGTIVAATQLSQPLSANVPAATSIPEVSLPVQPVQAATQVAPLPTNTATLVLTNTSTLAPTNIPTNPPPTQVPPTAIPPTTIPPTEIPPTPIPEPTSIPAPSVVLAFDVYDGTGEGCSALITYQVTGSPATGYFRVWNQWYADNGAAYDSNYPVETLGVGTGTYRVGLGGNGNPNYYKHKVWFEYNGTSSNVLGDLICPGLTAPP